MNNEVIHPIKRALISVSNKTGIVELAQILTEHNIEILSTGGTSKLLREAHIPVIDVAKVTAFPEMMDGRVKTLHPKIHGGILGLRDQHQEIAAAHQIPWIDLVIVNLYPFVETTQKSNVTFEEVIENIDIGGPAMIRSAAKNMNWVTVVVDPDDYYFIANTIKTTRGLSFPARQQLATKAFQHTAEYDAYIFQYLAAQDANKKYSQLWNALPKKPLRYGENPHQKAEARIFPDTYSILNAIQYQGKALSYNNIADADAAIDCVREFKEPACVIVKHANPCGVATANTILKAFELAYAADSISAFGGIVALNKPCTKELANKISATFFELIIAPEFSADALKIFSNKPNLRILSFDLNQKVMQETIKSVQGGLLIQEKDMLQLTPRDLKYVTEKKPTESEIASLLFAWRVVKHIKSNAILIAKNNVTVGIGAGQVPRIDAVDLALRKSKLPLTDCVLASDGFFPFRDSIDHIAQSGIKTIIQPGGGIRDAEVIAACNERGMTMVLTGIRCFKH